MSALVERDRVYHKPTDQWQDRVLWLWSEDDATMNLPDHERPEQAYRRMVGRDFDPKTAEVLDVIDQDYEPIYLMWGGWVIQFCPDGASIGVLYRETS